MSLEIIEYSLVFTDFPKKFCRIYMWINKEYCYLWGLISELPYGPEPNHESAVDLLRRKLRNVEFKEKEWRPESVMTQNEIKVYLSAVKGEF